MKKAKLIVTAMLVLAAVGGVLAFKSKDASGKSIFCDDGTSNHYCSVQVTPARIVSSGTLANCSSVQLLTSTCPQTYTASGD